MNTNEKIESTKKCNCIALLIVTAILFCAGGYLIGSNLFPVQSGEICDEEKIVTETKDMIKDRLIEGKIINPELEEIFALSGTIKEVRENYIIVAPTIRQNPLGDTFPETMKILLDENTKIEKWTLKSPEEYGKDEEQNPSPYNKEMVQLNDLSPDYFIISAKSENNIKGLNELNAIEINFSTENPFQ